MTTFLTKCLGRAFFLGGVCEALTLPEFSFDALTFGLAVDPIHRSRAVVFRLLNPAVYWALDNEFPYRAILVYSEVFHNLHNIRS